MRALPIAFDRVKRLVLFPAILVYTAALVLASWPRLLTPNQTPTAAQHWAVALFHGLGVYPGQEVFGGQGEIVEYPRRTCVQIAGLTPEGQRVVVYDDFSECDQDTYSYNKSPLGLLLHKTFISAVDQAHRPTPGNMGDYPLSYLLAITEYYCNLKPQGPFASLATRHRLQSTRVVDTKLVDRFYFGGSRRCDAPNWVLDPLPGWEDWARRP